jgi:hypothetical protein
VSDLGIGDSSAGDDQHDKGSGGGKEKAPVSVTRAGCAATVLYVYACDSGPPLVNQ